MDKFDQHILAELKKDARQSVSTLAEKVSLSRSAVSGEHLAIFAHFEEVSLPSKPSKSRLMKMR